MLQRTEFILNRVKTFFASYIGKEVIPPFYKCNPKRDWLCVYRFLVDSILITDKPYFCIDGNRNRFSRGAEAENLFRPTDPKCDHVIGFDTIREPRRESNRNFENDSAFYRISLRD